MFVQTSGSEAGEKNRRRDRDQPNSPHEYGRNGVGDEERGATGSDEGGKESVKTLGVTFQLGLKESDPSRKERQREVFGERGNSATGAGERYWKRNQEEGSPDGKPEEETGGEVLAAAP